MALKIEDSSIFYLCYFIKYFYCLLCVYKVKLYYFKLNFFNKNYNNYFNLNIIGIYSKLC